MKYISLMLIVFFIIIGCAGNYAHLKDLSDSESRAIRQELLDNWSDYDISYNSVVIVSDPKNDNKKILIPNYWASIDGQESMTQLANGTNKLPNGLINLVWGEPVREIWVNDQFFGYVGHRERELVSAQIIDENTVRLIHTHSGDWRN